MKSQRRHELQHNVLDQKLSNLVAWFKKYSNYIAWGVLLVAVVVLVVVFVQRSREKKLLDSQNQYAAAKADPDPDARLNALTKLADDEQVDKSIAAQATLDVANEYADRIISGEGKASKSQLKEFTDKATEYYQRVTARYGDIPAEVAQAYFGLAKLAENRGDFDEAAAQYAEAKKVSPRDYQIGKAAEGALQNLSTIKQPVKFATTAPVTATAPATAPASGQASTAHVTTAPKKAAPVTAKPDAPVKKTAK